MWRLGCGVDSKGYEGQLREEDPSGSEEAEEDDNQTRMPNTRLDRRRVLSTVAWTEEQKSVEACRGARAKTRDRNRLLYNRIAAEKGQHVLAPASGDKMRRVRCGQEAACRRILQWPRTRCKEREGSKVQNVPTEN